MTFCFIMGLFSLYKKILIDFVILFHFPYFLMVFKTDVFVFVTLLWVLFLFYGKVFTSEVTIVVLMSHPSMFEYMGCLCIFLVVFDSFGLNSLEIFCQFPSVVGSFTTLVFFSWIFVIPSRYRINRQERGE